MILISQKNIPTYIRTLIVLVCSFLVFSGCQDNPPTEKRITKVSDAIAVVQENFNDVSAIKPLLTPQPSQPDLIIAFDRDDHWDLVFKTGSGDCAAGCLNNYYWYFTVGRDGKVEKVGEFSRVFTPSSNDFTESGTPMWGFPR